MTSQLNKKKYLKFCCFETGKIKPLNSWPQADVSVFTTKRWLTKFCSFFKNIDLRKIM